MAIKRALPWSELVQSIAPDQAIIAKVKQPQNPIVRSIVLKIMNNLAAGFAVKQQKNVSILLSIFNSPGLQNSVIF